MSIGLSPPSACADVCIYGADVCIYVHWPKSPFRLCRCDDFFLHRESIGQLRNDISVNSVVEHIITLLIIINVMAIIIIIVIITTIIITIMTTIIIIIPRNPCRSRQQTSDTSTKEVPLFASDLLYAYSI